MVGPNFLRIKRFPAFHPQTWNLVFSGNPMPSERLSSNTYGWGLFTLWIVFLVSTIRKLLFLPHWRLKMLTWNLHRRCLEIMKHLLWLTVTIVIVPAFLNHGFNLRWFAAFLPDIALIVTILILDDSIQLLVKTRMMVKPKLMTHLHIYIWTKSPTL